MDGKDDAGEGGDRQQRESERAGRLACEFHATSLPRATASHGRGRTHSAAFAKASVNPAAAFRPLRESPGGVRSRVRPRQRSCARPALAANRVARGVTGQPMPGRLIGIPQIQSFA